VVTDNAFIDSHADSGLRSQIDEACLRARARRAVVCELRNPSDICSLALQGIGVAILPQRVASVIAADDADCVLRLDDQRAVQPISLVHRDPKPAGPAALAFLDLALGRQH
jgi:DNA-binding transcriptional LysR family regulator